MASSFRAGLPIRLSGALLFLALGGCAVQAPSAAPPPPGISDPYEKSNREIHEFNKNFDKAFFRPVSKAYGTVVPRPLRAGVSNVYENLATPGKALNELLQGDIDSTVHDTFRFIINSTLGVAGIFDPATSIGLEERDTDFDETLYVWGLDEGAYLEVPIMGPSNQRHLAGKVVGVFLDPIALFAPPGLNYASYGAWAGDNMAYRNDFSDTIDGVLYESADGYAQARVIFLENRRFKLGQTSETGTVDPYEELYGE